MHDMAAFDRAYIPARTLASQGQATSALKALRLLTDRWGAFRRRYGHDLEVDAASIQALAQVDAHIADANNAANTGQWPAVTDHLTSVGQILLTVRRSHQIAYYLDGITLLHSSLYAMTVVARDKSAETLSVDDIISITSHLPVAISQCEDLQQIPFDEELFSFTPAKTQTLRDGLTREANALRELRQALDLRDRGLLLLRIAAAEATFAGLPTLFGDFDRVK